MALITIQVTHTIVFPALQAYVNYLEGAQQKEIDSLTEAQRKSNAVLKESQAGLQSSVDDVNK